MKPALFACLKQYTVKSFFKDLASGIIVGIIALPLSIALGISSGVSPEKGLITAIIGGFLVSCLGGSRVQIGGPTGAFVVIVAGAVSKHGMEGLLIATMMAGVLLILAGVLRLGKLLDYIPYPVISGFTSGIAVVIFSTQIGDFLGLKTGAVPAEFLHKWSVYFRFLGTFSWQTAFIGAVTLAIILLWPKVNRRIPGTLIALLFSVAAAFFFPQADTIGTRFSAISASLPIPSIPDLSFVKIAGLFPTALTIAFLAGVESLLSATVADGMTGQRHDSNMELAAQGVANIGSALFGGIPVTGALARTAANIKNGGQSPLSGMIHSIILLFILLIGMPYVKFVPMAALAAVLMTVAFNMGEWSYFSELKHLPKSDSAIFLTAFLMTVLLDLVMAIGAALILAAVLVLIRLKNMVGMQEMTMENGTIRIMINGPIFFVAARKIQDMPKREGQSTLLLDLQNVPFMDASALKAMSSLKESLKMQGISLKFEKLQPQPQALLTSNGFDVDS